MPIVATSLICFAATLLHATLGFGTALVAMPLLALTVGVQTATPLVGFVVMTTTTIILWGSWRSLDLWVTWRLVLASVVGIPLGIFALKAAPELWIKMVLGVLLIAFSLYNLIRPTLMTVAHPGWVYLFGFVGGVLGGAYNTNAPPLVLYGALQRWSPERFRAILQGYFVPVSVLIWLGHGLTGLWTTSVVQLYLIALPPVLLAIFLGTKLNRTIPAHRFAWLLHAISIGLGVVLLVSARRA
jgi:hypothetical protein